MSNDPDFWLWAIDTRMVNPATGETINDHGAPLRPVAQIARPTMRSAPMMFVRRDERGSES